MSLIFKKIGLFLLGIAGFIAAVFLGILISGLFGLMDSYLGGTTVLYWGAVSSPFIVLLVALFFIFKEAPVWVRNGFLISLLIVTGFIIASRLSIDQGSSKIIKEGDGIIVQLEQFKKEQGKYPLDLDQASIHPEGEFHYGVKDEGFVLGSSFRSALGSLCIIEYMSAEQHWYKNCR